MTPDFLSYFFGVLVGLFGGFLLTRHYSAWSSFVDRIFGKTTEEKDSPLGFSDPLYAELEAEKYREAVEDWEEICNEK